MSSGDCSMHGCNFILNMENPVMTGGRCNSMVSYRPKVDSVKNEQSKTAQILVIYDPNLDKEFYSAVMAINFPE